MTSDEMPKEIIIKGTIDGGKTYFDKVYVRADIVPDDKNVADADIKLAKEILYKLCRGERLTMSVPVQEDDHDLVLGRVINCAATAKRDCEGLVRALEEITYMKTYLLEKDVMACPRIALKALAEYRKGRGE